MSNNKLTRPTTRTTNTTTPRTIYSSSNNDHYSSSAAAAAPLFSQILRNLNLKIDFKKIIFHKRKMDTNNSTRNRKNSSNNSSSSSGGGVGTLKSEEEISRAVLELTNKCPEINLHGRNMLFKVNFSCNDCRPNLENLQDRYQVERKKIQKSKFQNIPIGVIRVQVEFYYNNSISELVKESNGLNIEEDIVNSLITIIDMDDRQVYFKMKTNHFKDNIPEYRYIIIGKMDDSNHPFIFDVSYFAQSKKIPRNLKQLYEICTPKKIKNSCHTLKDGSKLYNDNNDIGIKRIGFGIFFRSDTLTKRHLVRYYSSRFKDSKFNLNPSEAIALINSTDFHYGMVVLAENEYRYPGKIEIGYYSWTTQGRSWRLYDDLVSTYYTCRLEQEVVILEKK